MTSVSLSLWIALPRSGIFRASFQHAGLAQHRLDLDDVRRIVETGNAPPAQPRCPDSRPRALASGGSTSARCPRSRAAAARAAFAVLEVGEVLSIGVSAAHRGSLLCAHAAVGAPCASDRLAFELCPHDHRVQAADRSEPRARVKPRWRRTTRMDHPGSRLLLSHQFRRHHRETHVHLLRG